MHAAPIMDREPARRRDFLIVMAATVGTLEATALAWPAITQIDFSPSLDFLDNTYLDLSVVQPGQSITLVWKGKPVFVRRRLKQEIEAARAVPLADLKDPFARNRGLASDAPATDANRSYGEDGEYIILIGICTHLGCVPLGGKPTDIRGDYGGWYCPCHGAHYDTAGRVRKGPAPENMAIPKYRVSAEGMLKI